MSNTAQSPDKGENSFSWPVVEIPGGHHPLPKLELVEPVEPAELVDERISEMTLDELSNLIDQAMKQSESYAHYRILWEGKWKDLGKFLATVHYKDLGFSESEYAAILDKYIPEIRKHDGPAIKHDINTGKTAVEAAVRLVDHQEPNEVIYRDPKPRERDWAERAAGPDK